MAADWRVQKWLDAFWHGQENRMDERIYTFQAELSLFGEQFVRFFVDPVSGRVVVRQLDPLGIVAI